VLSLHCVCLLSTVAVVVAFFICWAPFHAQRLLAVYARSNNSDSPVLFTVYKSLTYTSGVLYYMSTTVNPVLYHIMSHKFREAFKVRLHFTFTEAQFHISCYIKLKERPHFSFFSFRLLLLPFYSFLSLFFVLFALSYYSFHLFPMCLIPLFSAASRILVLFLSFVFVFSFSASFSCFHIFICMFLLFLFYLFP
jgi:hypothetical protein